MNVLIPYVDRLLALEAAGRSPASAATGVVTDGKREVAVGGWALPPEADADGVAMTRDTLLDLASVTKVASTTTLAMGLVAGGLLALEDPVRRYLPGFDGGGRSGVTVEQLFTHTAGLRPWWPVYCETTDRDEAARLVERLPLAAPPGTAWLYSDLGLVLVGRVIEEVTGQRLDAAFRSLVAEPLGLTASYGPVPPEHAAASADSDAYEVAMIASGQPYDVPFGPESFAGWRDHVLRGEVSDGNAAHAFGGVAGHAGLFGSIDDLLTLGESLLDGRLVPVEVIERFAAPTPLNPTQAVGFRRRVVDVGGTSLTLLHHPGFTGTFFGLALERPLVVAGGAMRLCGTVGPIPSAASLAPPKLVPGDEIHEVVVDAGLRLLDDLPSRPPVRNA